MAVQSDGMWKRLRRRTFAPSRPLLHDDQIGLAIFVVVALAAGIYFALRVVI
jgi:hypothetical protein